MEDYESDGGEMVDEVFTFTNTHTPEPPVDPCEDEGGCGGTDTTPPIETPETGRLVKSGNSAAEAMWLNNMIGGGVTLLAGAIIIVFTRRRKEIDLTK